METILVVDDELKFDLPIPGLDGGVSVLRRLMESRPSQPVFVLSTLSDVESNVRRMTAS